MNIANKIIIVLGLFLFSCGTSNIGRKDNGSNTNTKIHSQADFPYIEAFHQGMRLKIKGDTDAAITAFLKCLSFREDDAVYYVLSQLYIDKKDDNQAIAMMVKAYQLDSKNIWYVEQLAILYYDSKQFDKASLYFKKLVDYESKNLSWLYGYGDCLLKLGKVDEAISVINKAEIVLGKSPSLSLEKYNLYMSIKKEKEALNELEVILKTYPKEPQVIATLVDHYFSRGENEKGITFLMQLVDADPDNGRAHLALGEIYRKKGMIDQAFKEYKAAFQCEDIDLDTKMGLLISFQSTSLETKNEAMELVDMMLLSDSDSAKPYSIKGDYLLAQENEREALTYYKKALNIEKKQFPIWNQVMLLEYQFSLWDDLYTDSKECLNYFTTMPIVYLLNGVSAIQLNLANEALEVLNTGKSLIINDKKLEAEFLGQLGEANFVAKKYQEAKKQYNDAIKLDPGSNLLKNNFAFRLANAKIDFEQAMSLINQAINNSPNQANYYDTRGWIYFRQGKYEEALVDFTKAYELDDTSLSITEHLGDVYSKLNQTENALLYWEKALQLAPKKDTIMKKITLKAYYDEMD